ncbi:CDC27 family protein [Sulfurimonas sp.]|nr:CDC27 family protein [Sulfurimonas sp.]
MLNIHDLEVRQRKYKLKSYIPYIISFASILIVSTTIVFLYSEQKNLSTSKKIETQKHEPIKVEKTEPIVKNRKPKETTPVIPQQNKKLSFAPSMNFIKKIQSDTLPNYKKNEVIEEVDIDIKIEEAKKSITQIVSKPKVATIEKEALVQENAVKSTLSVSKNNSADIQGVIKRFKSSNSPALSLFIAKTYYKNKEYHKSYNYALITNEINNGIEDSWLIFAKSLVKLNEKEMAIETLKKYIKHSKSTQARTLLDEISSGKFK